jgi:SAM-dependent methyltransferase
VAAEASPRVAGLSRRGSSLAVAASADTLAWKRASYHHVVTDDLPEHVRANREAWDRYAEEFVEPGRASWSTDEVTWGIWGIPESEVRLLPDDLAGQDVVELGCGTAYVSAWLAKRGAKPVGIDNSPAQLETARRFQAEFGLEFPLHLGNAEATPFESASFDGAISEYGAALWADPYAWIPEAARLLRPGGWLMLLTNAPTVILTSPDLEADGPAGTTLLRPYFGMHRMTWPDDTSVEFHLPHGEWIRLLRDNGFEIERLVELRPAEDATTRWTHIATVEWARQWPSEEAWVARKRG